VAETKSRLAKHNKEKGVPKSRPSGNLVKLEENILEEKIVRIDNLFDAGQKIKLPKTVLAEVTTRFDEGRAPFYRKNNNSNADALIFLTAARYVQKSQEKSLVFVTSDADDYGDEANPDHFEKLDFELEVAIVNSTKGMNIRAEDTQQYIAGYKLMNDLNARRIQMEEMLLNLGPAKGKNFSTTTGPYLVTPDELAPLEIPPPSRHRGQAYDLRLSCRVNRQTVSEANLGEMDWIFGELAERVSYG
jgi:2-keto-4-pentenoate hydratase/2-oxohepta-3-ene-1,7-dioic acid hydratase in catechol pathway